MTNDDIQTKKWLCNQFTTLMKLGTPEERMEYVFEHPVLLSGKALSLIAEEKTGDQASERRLALLGDLRLELSGNPESYPRGLGPLERVLAQYRAGDIDQAEAIERARSAECAAQLSYAYIKAAMVPLADAAADDVGFALGAAEVALEAALAMPRESLAIDVRRGAAQGFIQVVHHGLMLRPDGRVFARAIEVGEWAVQDAERFNQDVIKGHVLHALGTMTLDAYCASFGPSPEFGSQVREWLARSLDPMPGPVDGLSRARDYLSPAVELRPRGSERGQTLKALLEAVVYEGYARGSIADKVEVSRLAHQALAELDSATDAATIARVNFLRGRSAAV